MCDSTTYDPIYPLAWLLYDHPALVVDDVYDGNEYGPRPHWTSR